MFGRWFDDAVTAGLHEPNAMVRGDRLRRRPAVVADGAAQGGRRARASCSTPTARSRKGDELAANPACSLLFPWHPLERQVRVDGTARLLDRAAVANYFARRPRGAQIGAHASHQSRPVADRAELEAAYDELTARFEGDDVPVPEEWGGYLVVPRRSSSGRAGPGGCTTGSSTGEGDGGRRLDHGDGWRLTCGPR